MDELDFSGRTVLVVGFDHHHQLNGGLTLS